MSALYSNVQDVPLAIAVFLANDTYDHDDRPNVISATSLLKPLRQLVLPHRIPPGLALPTLASRMRTALGRAIHDAIERAWLENHVQCMINLGYPQSVIDRVRINPPREALDDDIIPVYVEQRVEKQVGKWIITGKFDIVAEGRVQDFKTATVWSYLNQVNKEKQSQQGSIYRWLNPDIVYDDEIDIHHIFFDWQGSKAEGPNYPPRDFIMQTIPLMSMGETEHFIRRKITLIEKYWDAKEEDIPECSDEELWRTDPVYKYFGKAENTKSSKVFTDKSEAYVYLADKGKGEIREVKGSVNACRFCSAFQACTQKDALIREGDLSIKPTQR
jgi:hypothetical protein